MATGLEVGGDVMDWTEVGLGGGIVIVVLGFLAFLKGERKDRKEMREGFLKTIENHINHNSGVIEALHNWLKGRIGGD